MTTIPTLSTLPPMPTRALSEAAFRAAGDLAMPALNTLQTELNTSIGQMNTVAGEVIASEAVCIAAANFKGSWSDQTGAASVPYSVSHSSTYWMLLSDLADVTAKTPGVDSEWLEIGNPIDAYLTRESKGANYTLLITDLRKIIDYTGTWTLSFDPAATLAAGWYCYVRNTGTGEITLDPDGAETIDGLATYKMYPGEVRLIQCNGTNLTSIVLNSFYTSFASSGTFTTPPGYTLFEGLLWGGGASGRGHNNNINCGGGGGGCVPFKIISEDQAATITVTIGAGGAGVYNVTPNVGGDSTLACAPVSIVAYGGGAVATLGGGGGGAFSYTKTVGSGSGCAIPYDATPTIVYSTPGMYGSLGTQAQYGGNNTGVGGGGGGGYYGTGIVGVGGNAEYGGGGGGGGCNNGSRNGGAGGNSFYGGGGGGGGWGSTGTGTGALGGTSINGGDGGDGAASSTGAGSNGTAPGGGGGAAGWATSSATSGSGADGELRIWGII